MSTVNLILPYVRAAGTVAINALDIGIPTVTVGPAALGGLYVAPFILPYDYDRTRDGRLFVVLCTAGGIGGAAGNVLLSANATVGPPAAIVATITQTTLVPIPATWPNLSWMEVELLNGTAPIFPAFSLTNRSVVGFRVVRDGPNALDTYPSTIGIPLGLRLQYNRLCSYGDCP